MPARIEDCYQAIIGDRFPAVTVIRESDLPDESIHPILAAYGVPDDRMPDFVNFMANQLREEVLRQSLPLCVLLPYSISDTKEYYPEVWEQIHPGTWHATSTRSPQTSLTITGTLTVTLRDLLCSTSPTTPYILIRSDSPPRYTGSAQDSVAHDSGTIAPPSRTAA